jgi:ATP-dependent DNA helicase RecQ
LHVVDRKRRFEDLQIDFDELQRRKDAEQAKLNQMIRFATSGRCRQLEILEYFGDPDRRQCGNCDNCAKYSASAGKHHDLPGEEVSKACLYVAQVSLSGIARTKSRVGKSVVAQMLTGSSSKRVKQLHLDKLSTFALLKSLRQSDVAEILEALIERGFAQQVEHTKFRPVIVITHRGQELMMGKSKQDPGRLFPAPLIHAIVELYRLRHPVAQGVGLSVPVDSSSLAGSPHKPPPIEPSPTPEGQPVLSPNESKSFSNTDLPALDKDSGRIRETIDPFEPGVEYDLALSEHPEPALITWDSGADEDPVDRSDLDGKVRLDAAVVLPSELNLGQHPRLNHAAERNAIRVAKLPLPEPGQLKPSYFWTVQLLSAGYSVEQVEQIRKLDRAAILDHVTRGFDEGLETDPGQVLSAEKILRLREFLRQREGASIGQLLLDLPAPLTPAELLVFVRFLGRTDTIPAR